MVTNDISSSTEVPWLAVGPKDGAEKCKYVTQGGLLGDGHFSVVKECMNVYTRDLFALKLVSKKTVKNKLELIRREVQLLATISEKVKQMEKRQYFTMDIFEGHHHVLQLFDYFETSESIALVMQLCSKGDLYEKIIEQGHLDLNTQVRSYTACMVSVLEFLHGQNIVHRDIKAENVLFRLRVNWNEPHESQGDFPYDLTAHDLILADFGFAAPADSGASVFREYVGTTSYIAPEIVHCKDLGRMSPSEVEHVEPYGFAVDIWALGVLTYFMALGYMPFDCDSGEETLNCILTQDYYVDEKDENDPKMSQFWSFVQLCFNLDPKGRPMASELKKHPFIRDYFARGTYLESASATPHSMKRNEMGRSLKAPRKSCSSGTLTYMQLEPSCNGYVSPAKSGPVLEPETAATRQRALMQVRDTLKRALSTTALRGEFLVLPEVTKGMKKASTFKLGPQPPAGSLMNGCYSTTPESRSTVNTPRSVSRASSSTSMTIVQNPQPVQYDDDDEGIVI